MNRTYAEIRRRTLIQGLVVCATISSSTIMMSCRYKAVVPPNEEPISEEIVPGQHRPLTTIDELTVQPSGSTAAASSAGSGEAAHTRFLHRRVRRGSSIGLDSASLEPPEQLTITESGQVPTQSGQTDAPPQPESDAEIYSSGFEGIVSPGVEVREAELPEDWAEPVNIPVGDPARDLVGVWTQIDGPNDPDYATGGYTRGSLIFTGASKVFTIRRVGEQLKETTIASYRVENSRLVLDPSKGEAPDLLRQPIKVTLTDGSTRTVLPPRYALPRSFRYSLKESVLRIGTKSYKRSN